MSRDISVSAEYVWPASTGLSSWVVDHLKERVHDESVWSYADRAGFEELHNFRVYELPEPGRHEVLRVLAEEVPAAYGAWARERGPRSEAHVAGEVHHLEILAMMAVEVLRELDQRSAE
ncbi:hypothetical protein [Nonomuraea rhodomycinica]|uniref:Uncharacterized protein n=1 Tax=Nonomuraea rhodomycinica TaxID=1712872 RepID=A0A7Y6IN46_9ACTN|nr:hypothetical protein [Nonomuraea rhodomycinica]NUW41246.1 hypothetical protein [Nonomuraea rhodomycinica]